MRPLILMVAITSVVLSCKELALTGEAVSALPLRLKARTDIRSANYTN